MGDFAGAVVSLGLSWIGMLLLAASSEDKAEGREPLGSLSELPPLTHASDPSL